MKRRRQARIDQARREWAARLDVGPRPGREERLAYWRVLLRLGVDADQIGRWDAEEQRRYWLARTEAMFEEVGF